MYGTATDSVNDIDRYLELAARIEWDEQGSVERPRPVDAAAAFALSASEPLRG
ncbi:hypothetical protein [Cryptosporangium phraense]|uniref:hypothetical protein n=1 Tax=Cryptosporangium phraense TaxID=2593070 RepID=UPI001478F70B|nr:hypothetical protein [Cryptosporangium phraense]